MEAFCACDGQLRLGVPWLPDASEG